VSTAGQTMIETEKSSDHGEISAVTVHLGQLPVSPADELSVICRHTVTQKPINTVLAQLQ